MFQLLFIAFLLFHGFLHWIGYRRAFRDSGSSEENSQANTNKKIHDIVWLSCTALWWMSAIAFYFNADWWWIICVIALIFSQILIFLHWKIARYGSLVNLLIAIPVFLTFSSRNFERTCNNEILALNQAQENRTLETISDSSLNNLPFPVQRWLRHSGIVGKEKIQRVQLSQTGSMLTQQGGKWLSARANQYFTVQNPAFVWTVNMEWPPFMSISGRDKFENGKGNMLIKVASVYTIANSTGAETDQGSAIRYLAEMVWFPSAALEKYIQWEAVDSHSAKAVMRLNNQSVDAIFSFDTTGNVFRVEALRFGEFNGKYSKEKWVVNCSSPKEFSGITIPSKSEVTWKLQSGDFTWFKLEIEDILYNQPFKLTSR